MTVSRKSDPTRDLLVAACNDKDPAKAKRARRALKAYDGDEEDEEKKKKERESASYHPSLRAKLDAMLPDSKRGQVESTPTKLVFR